jgi:hypothetical protein
MSQNSQQMKMLRMNRTENKVFFSMSKKWRPGVASFMVASNIVALTCNIYILLVVLVFY